MSRNGNAASGGGVPQAVPPPPWLWLALATYVYDVPAAVTWWREQIQNLWTDREYPAFVVSGDAFAALRVMLISQALPTLFVAAGAAAVLLPHIRGRYTEWRYHLVPPANSPASPALQEIQRLLDAHAPGTVLTVSMRVRGPSIRVYTRSWRGRRVAVSLGFLSLWERHPDRARALLLHEVAHLANGEHLITGLGSPFTGLVGAWPVVFLVCAVTPLVWLIQLQTFAEPSLLTAEVLAVVARLPQLLIVPVIALWCAELAADRYAVAAAGPRTVLEALDATKASGLRRVTGKLYHPPRALRRWFVERADRPVAPLLLLLAGPIALLVHVVAVTAIAIPSFILNDYAPLTAVATSFDLAHINLLRWPRWAGVLAVVLLWPLLAKPWLRLWGKPTSAPTAVPGTPTGPGRPARADGIVPYPRRAHLLAALLPAAVLVVTLLPSTGVVARDPLLRPDTATAQTGD